MEEEYLINAKIKLLESLKNMSFLQLVEAFFNKRISCVDSGRGLYAWPKKIEKSELVFKFEYSLSVECQDDRGWYAPLSLVSLTMEVKEEELEAFNKKLTG